MSRPVGRPTVYDQKFCQMLEDHMEHGLSFEAFAAVAGVSRQTLYTWCKLHYEFLDTKDRAEAKSLLWWEKQGLKGLWNQKEFNEDGKPISHSTFNTSNWIFQMKNRHKWADKHEMDIKTEDVTEREKIRQMSMPELQKLVKEHLPKEEE